MFDGFVLFRCLFTEFGPFGLGGDVGLFGVSALDFACACSGSFTFGFLLLLVWICLSSICLWVLFWGLIWFGFWWLCRFVFVFVRVLFGAWVLLVGLGCLFRGLVDFGYFVAVGLLLCRVVEFWVALWVGVLLL